MEKRPKPLGHVNLCAALSLAAALWALGIGPALADEEQQIGAQEYQQLKDKGEIIARPSALYGVLDPIAARIAKVADPQYEYPFQFILVHEAQPNAFAVPGGNVYVTDSLMKFVQNQEELAGVLCHETSHDIHHDVVNLNAKEQTQGAIIGILGALTGISNSGLGQLGENVVYTLGSDHFSRTVESAADHKGAITCAQAGYNPWGMVWLFQRFQSTGQGGSMEMLSDHPTDGHRIADLEREFRSDPALFGRYSASKATATPLHAAGPATAAGQPAERTSNAHPPCAEETPDISVIQGN
jgi:predicted Zn-dependent protease